MPTYRADAAEARSSVVGVEVGSTTCPVRAACTARSLSHRRAPRQPAVILGSCRSGAAASRKGHASLGVGLGLVDANAVLDRIFNRQKY